MLSILHTVKSTTAYKKKDGSVTGTGSTTLYVYGYGLISEKIGDITLYHHYNNLGSTMKLTDAKGTVKATYTYGTYGELLSSDDSLTRFLYNGRCGVTTDNNGLYYMRLRYYSPDIKRFVNQDILSGSITNSQSLNRYSYVQGNPVSYTDPFGLSPSNGLFSGTNFVHALFGMLSCVPGIIGITASLADAIVYAVLDKDYGMALACVAGATVPTMLRMFAKGAKCATTAARLMKTADLLGSGVSFLVNTRTFGDTALKMYDKYVIRGEDFSGETVIECISLAFSAIGMMQSAKGFLDASKGLASITGNLCFVAGTQIVTEDGSKNIEDIEVGDYVYSKDTISGETGYKKVVQVFCNETTELLHVQIGDEIITTTPKHPFWVEGYGFKEAALLEPGDLVETTEGKLLPVTNVWMEYLDEPVNVYNFEVEDWHTYYVSDSGIWVHNAKCEW